MRTSLFRILATVPLALLLASQPGCAGGNGDGEEAPPIDELALCTGKAAARMYALVTTFDGILRFVDNVAELPPGVAEYPANTFHFDVFADHVVAEMSSSYDLGNGFDVNEVAVFHWTLAQGTVPTGEGQFSLVRLSGDRLRATLSGTENPSFHPDSTCTYALVGMDFYVYFISDPEQMHPGGSGFQGSASVGGDTLAGLGMVDDAAGATMTGTYLGTAYAYEIDLRDGSVALP